MTDTDAVTRFEAGLADVREAFGSAFGEAADEQSLRAANAKLTGPEGTLTKLMKLMREVPGDRRREFGQAANALKEEVAAAFDGALVALAQAEREAELAAPHIDVSLPGRRPKPGRLHPITRVTIELVDIFTALGFDVAHGPEIDLYEYNFDKLGFPPDHPATDMQDSFFVKSDGARSMLRTHTSTIQVREMLKRKPPLAIVAPGAVYRRDDDITHSPMFFQIEGLLVDEKVSFADLKGVLTRFAQRLFGPDVGVRGRPSYFPFVEPGAEIDISCVFCKPWEGDAARTAACRVCKGTGWLEILGCGMVHPVVFESVGYDPEKYTGFAFGLGIDRIAMLKYGISDIRMLYENDARFLEQIG
ncbi:MAG: phenylalanine--tRNA ligase subunit alpha [Deltaproteobacteria bacterium]|nr:MAG: phenylalanine--tRNA ligase subunit alpha [Deltaproteobacteria bacterium]